MITDMLRLILFFFLFMLSSWCHAQYQLELSHPDVSKTYVVKEGDYLKLRYFGYEGQEAEVENYVMEVSPTYILYQPPMGKNKYGDDQVIMIDDITGFKKMNKIRPLLPPLTSLGLGIGIYYTIGTNDNLSNNEQFLYSLGASIGVGLLIKWVFKTDIKLKVSDGWTVRVAMQPEMQ